VQIGSQRRSSIIFAKAKELIDSGAIGDVRLIEDTSGRNTPCGAWVYPPPPGLSTENLDWETWQGSAPKHPFLQSDLRDGGLSAITVKGFLAIFMSTSSPEFTM